MHRCARKAHDPSHRLTVAGTFYSAGAASGHCYAGGALHAFAASGITRCLPDPDTRMIIPIEPEDKPAILLETLTGQLPDATVRYERASLQHRFNVEHAGLSFELQLPAFVLERKDLRELEEVAHNVARQVRSYRA
jgi:hypothetical protein